MVWGMLLAALIELPGVTGGDLRARAFFDANNVRVGDPLVLTVDFLGQAEFHDLHPPALAGELDPGDWKLDEASAKTMTYRDARRITYRVRPMRAGVLWFPALEFAYTGPDGIQRTVRANEIPVHARAGRQVVMAGMEENPNALPSPPELVRELGPESRAGASDDDLFAWRKACAKPSADAFAKLDFPEARLNEASCALKEGNWARAVKIYRSLEWHIGQTPEIERGLTVALAMQYENPQAELPVWRQVLRPLLRHAWPGRVGIVVGGLLGLMLLLWLTGRCIRWLASAAVVLLAVLPASADTVVTVTTNADGSVVRTQVIRDRAGNVIGHKTTVSSSGVGLQMGLDMGDPFADMEEFFGRVNGRRLNRRPSAPLPKAVIEVGLSSDKSSVVQGEDFTLTLCLDQPKFVTFTDSLGLTFAEPESRAFRQVGAAAWLTDLPSKNPTNVIRRLAFPMRAQRTLAGPVRYVVAGDYVDRRVSRGGMMLFGSFARTTRYASGPRTMALEVGAVPEEGRPDDFSGIVCDGLRIHETCDRLKVATNDVVTVTYRMFTRGDVPKDFLPPGAAFAWATPNAEGAHEYRRFWVADGSPVTPKTGVTYYDTRRRRYVRVETGGTALRYVPEEESP